MVLELIFSRLADIILLLIAPFFTINPPELEVDKILLKIDKFL